MNAIEAINISKIYKIYDSPVQRMKEIFPRRTLHSEFAALNNINFTVKKGETFGIIGENGAGKSTLLKILANTLKPTSGLLHINGRVAALLELGAGFNPELTGEENIYLNAYLMGLKKDEVLAKRDEIVSFSELSDFIKRPVKTYSSGMYVRLAFSIATSVDPDILIVDEALSVGDEYFQKKCIDRMMDFRRSGKTILFCSHSMYLVQELCSRSAWLKNGRIEKCGETSRVINAYNDWLREKQSGMRMAEQSMMENEEKTRQVWVDEVQVTDESGNERSVIRNGQPINVRIKIRKSTKTNQIKGHIGISINRNDEQMIYGVTTKMDGIDTINFYDGQVVTINFPTFPLLAGQYYIMVALADDHALHPYDFYRTKMFSVENIQGDLGLVKLKHSWRL